MITPTYLSTDQDDELYDDLLDEIFEEAFEDEWGNNLEGDIDPRDGMPFGDK